jgi:cobalt-zinc-cadmium efflux system outer membrane protein
LSLLRHVKFLLLCRLLLRPVCAGIALSMVGPMAAQVQPLSLQQAVDYALQHRPELRASDLMILAGERNKDQAGAIPNPRFLFRKEDFVDHANLGASSQTYYEGSQLLETSGKRGGRLAVAAQDLVHAHLQAGALRRRIALNVREVYWEAAASQALARLYAEDDTFFKQIIAYNTARFHEGKLAEVDLLRIQLQGQQIHAAAVNASLDDEKITLQLSEEMNAPGAHWTISADFETLEEPKALPVGEIAADLRSEGLLSKHAIDQTQAQIRLAKANGRPDLLLSGGYKRDVNIDSPVASVQFDIPLFNHNQAAVVALRAEEDAERETYAATKNRLSAELLLAQRTYEGRKAQFLETFVPLRDRAIEISGISRAAYKEGGLDLLRLLDAERMRVDAQLSYVRALQDVHLSVVELDYAEGLDQ